MYPVSLAGRLLLLLVAGAAASKSPVESEEGQTVREVPGEAEEFLVGFQYKNYECSKGQVTVYDDFLAIVASNLMGLSSLLIPYL